MRTSHRLHHHLGIQGLVDARLGLRRSDVGLEVPIDPQPMHFPTAEDLLFTDDRDVVLGLASHHAGVAASALVEVDSHPPLVILIDFWFFPQGRAGMNIDDGLSELRLLFVFEVGAFADELGGSFCRFGLS